MDKKTAAALRSAIANAGFTLRAIKNLRVCDEAHGAEIDPTELDYAEYKARTLLEILHRMREQEAASLDDGTDTAIVMTIPAHFDEEEPLTLDSAYKEFCEQLQGLKEDFERFKNGHI